MSIFYSVAMILSAFVTGVAVRGRVDYAVLVFGLGTMFFYTMLIRQYYINLINSMCNSTESGLPSAKEQ